MYVTEILILTYLKTNLNLYVKIKLQMIFKSISAQIL